MLIDFSLDNIDEEHNLYLKYIESNGIDKEKAKLVYKSLLNKEKHLLTLKNAMLFINLNELEEQENILKLMKSLDSKLWKCEKDNELSIDNCRLNYIGFMKLLISIRTKLSEDALDNYTEIDTLCNKLFMDSFNNYKEKIRDN